MNQNRWIRPAVPAMVAAIAGFGIAATSALAQTAPATPPPQEEKQAEDVIQLSPFQVDASKDKGYFAENTLAGSRMKTNIADLGASISVITKQQLDDTASVDINDVFRYEINTEGSSTYTPAVASMRNDGVLDTIAGGTQGSTVAAQTNATANRVRGIGVPSSAINYYPSIGQIPMDAYNVQSLEISRGPNSMLFGMGSPAGIVNQTTAQAALNRNTNTATVRLDQWGSYRGSFAFNRGLIKDKVAIYGAVLYDDRSFQRKPSYDRTRRQYGAITLKPFDKTVIRASVEGYNNSNRRPNTITPRDYVSEWRSAGRPVYDPLTKKVTIQATGEVVGPFINDMASPLYPQAVAYVQSRKNYDASLWNATKGTYNGIAIYGDAALTNTSSIMYVPGLTWTNQARTFQQIYNGQMTGWYQPLNGQRYRNAWGKGTDPSASADLYPVMATIWASPLYTDVYNRSQTQSAGWSNNPNSATLGGYKYAGVHDKSVYDWTDININQMNFGKERNTSANVEFEQEITKDLFFTGGWMRQDFDSFTNYTVAQLNAATLFVDTNKFLPDGTPNPYFGLPYVEDQDADRYVNAETDDHFRAMLAYTPDFTRKSGWMRWLGRHQLLGLVSRDEYMQTTVRQRLEYIDAATMAGKYRYMNNQNAKADGSLTGWNFQSTSLRRQFYLGNPGETGGSVTRSSGEWNPLQQTGNIRVFNYDTGQFEDQAVTVAFNNFDGGTGRQQRTLQSYSAGMTNYLWNERIVTTFGARKDLFKARNTSVSAITQPNGAQPIPALTSPEKWSNGYLDMNRIMNRWDNWQWLTGYTNTMGAVIRPFKGWDGIEQRANSGNQFWQFVRDFGLSINKSNNFNAPPSAQVDAFNVPLPKPTGDGKDVGVQFSMFDNKLFARVTYFEATNENERQSGGAAISRLTNNMDTSLFRKWARTIALINMGRDPTVNNWDTVTASEDTQVQAAAEKIWQQPYTYYDGKNIGATRSAKARGVEAQINYNPMRNWTMKFTFGKQDTKYTNVLKEFDAWYAQRAPIWKSAKATDFLLPQYKGMTTWTTSGGRPVDITNFWASYGFDTSVVLNDSFGNTNVENYYNINVAPQAALARDLNGQSAPGQRKYRWSYMTNYGFDSGRLKGWAVGGSERWEDKAVIGYYGKASGAIAATPNLLDMSDTRRPIYDDAHWYTDLWVSYTRKIMDNRVRMKLQLNVSNAFEPGGLRVVGVNYDGSPYGYRIIDPRQVMLTATFDF